MGYVLLGHGGLELKGSYPDGMGVVAIPAGTTIQYYQDTGQTSLFSNKELDVWEQLDAPWPPLDSTNVTYNFELSSESAEQYARELQSNPSFGGHTLLLPGRDLKDPILLCTGTPDTCPTDPRMITGQVEGPRTHDCDGILGSYSGELFWIACTVVAGGDAETDAVLEADRGDAPRDVLLGSDPDDAVANALDYLRDYPNHFPTWFDALPQDEKDVLLRDPGIKAWNDGRDFEVTEWNPSDADLQAVADVNQPYVKGLDEGDDGTWEVGGFLVLLGDGHGYTDWVRDQDDYASGTFQVKRARFGAGELVFSGVPPVHQGTITSAVGRFSEKEVVFE